MLGDVSPQTIRLTAQAVVYPGRDHVVRVTIEKASGRRYVQADLSAVTRAVLVFLGTDPVIAYDSLVDPVFTFGAGGVLEIDLSDYAMPASILSSHLILFDAEHTSGQVIVDDTDVELVFDFRNVSATGTTPPPSVEYVTEAPLDGGLYGRQNGGWVSIADVVAGVASVNGQTGIVTLDAADVGADPTGEGAAQVALHEAALDPHPQYQTQAESDARYERGLTAGANITIDRTDPNAPVISATGGGGAVDSVNGQTGVVVLDAADVGADAAGTAAAEAEDARFQSTGLISGGVLSINADTTKFDVSAVTAVFVDYTNPAKSVATVSTFGPFTAVTVPNLASALVSYVGINSSGTLVQQTTKFTNEQRRSIVSLGAVVHSNKINLNAVNTLVAPARQLLNQFGDGIRAIGQLNLSGNVYAPLGATLQIQRSAGELFSPGANFHDNPNDPHAALLGAASPVSFRYRLANSTEYGDRDTINPASYDNAGVLTAVPANRYTVQLIALFQSGITRIQYGQTLYNTMSDAVAAAKANGMALEPNIAENGVIRGYIAIKGDATDLTNATQAVFITLSKFSATASVSPITIATTDELAEGGTNLYFTVTRVRQTLLTGISFVVNTAITAADTVLDALGKLQAQITSHFGVGGSTHPNATTSVSGFMSGADKTKLDEIAPEANNYVHPNHTGDVTSVGDGAQTIANNAVTNAKMADMATATIKGRTTAGTGDPEDLTAAQARSLLNVANGATALSAVQALTSSRNLALADVNTFNVNSTTNPYTVTIPLQSAVAWTADAEVHFLKANTGNVVITAAAGVLLNGVDGGSVTISQTSGAASIKRRAADSWWVGGLLGTAEEQRTALGLGSAATATAQTSVTDNTPGRLALLGMFGFGGDSEIVTAAGALNSLAGGPSRVVRFSSGDAISVGAPIASAGVVFHLPYTTTGAVQFYVPVVGGVPRLFVRIFFTTWSAWTESWTGIGTNLITADTGSFGYGVGAGGTVTQATSKSTAVTLNKPCGRITTAADSLAAGAITAFTLNSTVITATDIVVVNATGANAIAANYRVDVRRVSTGVAQIRIENISASAQSEAIEITFSVIKGSIT